MINPVDYLICPICKWELECSDRVYCKNCSSEFWYSEWVFVLIDLNSLPEHLQGQVKYFENETITNDLNYSLWEWQKNYIKRFLDNFKDIKDKVIIDCGTWSGYMAVELAKLWAKVIVTDLTLRNLIRLKKISDNLGLSENMIFVCCSAENLPIKDKTVDYFISNAVIEHLPKEKEAIAEIDRICLDNAWAMITVPLSYKYLNPLLVTLNYIHDIKIGHLRRYNQEILVEKFSNWNLLSTYYTGHSKKVFKTIANIFVKMFDESIIEADDSKKVFDKWWASNIICFFKR